MGLGDLGNAVVILLIFMFLHLILALSIGLSTIKQNWPKYKCNPAVMPFADIFGYDVAENYNECIKDKQIKFMQVFLKPIGESLEMFATMGMKFSEQLDDIKYFGLLQNVNIGNISSLMKNKILGVGSEISQMYITIKDVLANLFSMVTVLYYMIQGGMMTAETIFTENITGTIIGAIAK